MFSQQIIYSPTTTIQQQMKHASDCQLNLNKSTLCLFVCPSMHSHVKIHAIQTNFASGNVLACVLAVRFVIRGI